MHMRSFVTPFTASYRDDVCPLATREQITEIVMPALSDYARLTSGV